jgi:hypothetical protein
MAGSCKNCGKPSIPKIKATSGPDTQLPVACFHGSGSSKFKI